jgi:hypothetical protein
MEFVPADTCAMRLTRNYVMASFARIFYHSGMLNFYYREAA